MMHVELGLVFDMLCKSINEKREHMVFSIPHQYGNAVLRDDTSVAYVDKQGFISRTGKGMGKRFMSDADPSAGAT